VAALAALAVVSRPASACGLEDPNSIASLRGALQFAYPKALHVGTAVWQAQLAGELPPDAIARRDDLSPEARARLRLVKANAMLGRFAARLAAGTAGNHPPLAVVLVGPVLWTRIEGGDGPVRAEIHVSDPATGDVVAVTEVAVVEAFADGSLDVATAIDRGLLRLYGDPAAVRSAHAWLAAATRG
jgi:hypothetical protein